MAQAIEPVSGAAPAAPAAEGWWARQALLSRLLYWGLHVACLAGFWVSPSAGDLALLGATFIGRMFFVTGAYHRYFAHKSFKTSRPFQFLLALGGASATQKGPLWWASHHRVHHSFADQPGKDVHSPKEGFLYAHQGWVFDSRWDRTDLSRIPDFARYPELVWLNRWHILVPVALAIACLAVAGWSGLLWGFAISTVALWHATYSINSLAHLVGRRRYDTNDTSRNNWVLALLTLGEGWHNNHHHYCASVRQGFYWWEVDVTYYLLRGLAALGLVWDLREPPAHVLEAGRRPRELREAA